MGEKKLFLLGPDIHKQNNKRVDVNMAEDYNV